MKKLYNTPRIKCRNISPSRPLASSEITSIQIATSETVATDAEQMSKQYFFDGVWNIDDEE